jgi:general secretion pathway protein F
MQFELKVVSGQTVSALHIEAADAAQATAMAQAQGWTVLAARSLKSSHSVSPFKRGGFSLILFSQELLMLLDSGMSLIEAMETLTEKEQHAESRAVLQQVMNLLYEGLPLSGALERFNHFFPALYVALIRSSERTGDMVQALSRHVAYQGQLDALRKKIVTASIYPALLLGVGGLVIVFLMGYVVPKFSTIYESSGANLPWLSQLLLQWGRLISAHGGEVFLVFVTALAVFAYALSRSSVRSWLLDKLWRLPALHETLRIYQLARFYRTLGMLLQGGIPLVTGMQMVAGLLQPALRQSLQWVEQDIREGKALSNSMQQHQMTTPVALRMLRVGERTGRMGEMMERIGLFYDDEIARAVDWFTRLLEPVLMVIIGLVIGTVVTLMYMPIFDLAGSVQ